MVQRGGKQGVGLALAVAVAVIAVVAGRAWLTRAPESEPAAVGIRAEPSRSANARVELAPAAGAETALAGRVAAAAAEDSATIAASDAQRAVLDGRVVERGSEVPVAAVAVAARIEGAGGAREVEIETDAEGRFTIAGDGAQLVTWIAIGVGPRTAAREFYPRLELAPGAVATLSVEVGAGARLAGRVVDTEGRPIAGAQVAVTCADQPAQHPELADRTATTDAHGSFEIEHVGEQFVATASAAGFVCCQGARGELQHGADLAGVEIVLARPFTAHGRVVDAGGAPQVGADVWLGDRWMQPGHQTDIPGVDRVEPVGVHARTGADGRFEVGGVPRRAVAVSVEAAGRMPWSGQVEPAELDAPGLEIVLASGTALSGRVVHVDGHPAVGARVRLGSRRMQSGTTDEAGRFEFEGLAAARWRFDPATGEAAADNAPWPCWLSISAEGAAVDWRLVDVAPAEPGGSSAPNHVEIRLEPELELAGRVIDVDGAPVAGAELEIEGQRIAAPIAIWWGRPATWEYLGGAFATQTDADGRFRFGRLYPGDFVVRVRPPGRSDVHAQAVATAGETELVLRLDPASTLRVVLAGRVTDATTGEPVQSFQVVPMVSDPTTGGGAGKTHTIEDVDGRFELAGYEPAKIDVVVKAAGYARWTSGQQELELGRHEFDVRLWPERTLRLGIVDAEGRLIEGVRATFVDREDKSLSVSTGRGATVTDLWLGAGRQTVHGLPASPLRIRFVGKELARSEETAIDLSGPGPHELDFIAERRAPVPRFEVLVFVQSAPPGETPRAVATPWEGTAHEPSWTHEPLTASDARAVLQDADGRTRAHVAATRLPDARWSVSGGHWEGTGDGPLALPLEGEHPGHPLTLQVTAAGHEPLDTELDLPLDIPVVVLVTLPRS